MADQWWFLLSAAICGLIAAVLIIWLAYLRGPDA